ncbi:MAG: 2-oxoacid:acceptor oxidoreductase family protein [Desulfobacterales bacterium]|nr:MAG: 2-oxoacid:acceptor oxidoreductase family protein [Desulfobacterales bacterium]UCD89368.1 MAG: 2-oxoacid:acceptor oxidoreductase family protein [Desulfobacterales bacterium]
MTGSKRQQLIISGVGGQGVIFLTRLLAETAIRKGKSVFTSETHGMAQRGGTVISHLKVGGFSSPLIRPFKADGLLALRMHGLDQHGVYLKPDSWAIVNHLKHDTSEPDRPVFAIGADRIAQKIDNLRSVNLIVLGFAMAVILKNVDNPFFCSLKDIKAVLESQMGHKQKMLNASLTALETGYDVGMKAKF